jgi:hypothetical protein
MKASCELQEFFRTGSLFTLGLLLALFLTDALLGWRYRRNYGAGTIGVEVHQAVRKSETKNSSVNTVILGDSVARQLFGPRAKRQPGVFPLPTNQAISMAGQYYLLENCVENSSGLRDVYLFYIPGCFANNLPRELSRDYFCGHFHSPRAILEVFRLKKDFELSAAHIGRFLLPNLMAANSAWHPAPTGAVTSPPHNPGGVAPPEPEPLLSLLTKLFRSAPETVPQPAYTYGPALSPISQHYLDKARALCVARSIRLHVLPCPLSKDYPYEDAQKIYDAEPLRVDPTVLVDPVHFKEQFLPRIREQMIRLYDLPLETTSAP